jgi:hypothetical protein
MKEERNHCELLLRHVPEDRKAEFSAYMVECMNAEYSDIEPMFMGFMDDYEKISELFESRFESGLHSKKWRQEHGRRPEDLICLPNYPHYTVYDVGCAEALQHVFFSKAAGYVGIDGCHRSFEVKFVYPNCRYVQGMFSTVVDDLNIDPDKSIGIACMSILYHRDKKKELEAFDRAFKHKVVI